MGVPKDKRLGLTRRKGWPAFVWGYNNYEDNYDKTDWNGEGTKKPKKVEEVSPGHTRITF